MLGNYGVKMVRLFDVVRMLPGATVCFCLLVSGQSASATVDLVSVSVSGGSGSSQSNVPVTFGQVFPKGEIIDTSILGARLDDGTSLPLQVDAKTTHADGSLRHAVITTVLGSLPANADTTVTLHASGSNAAGATVGLAELLATNFDTVVSLNVGGTVYTASARDLLQSASTDSWLSGPLVSEWLVAGPLATAGGAEHAHLVARFHVRAYSGLESVRVSVTVENNWARVSGPRNIGYDATVTVQGRGSVLSQSNVTHYRQARWRRVFWWGVEPSVEVAHDTGYMERMGVIPTYDPRLSVPESVLAGMDSRWNGGITQLMAEGLISTYMPAGGGRPDIAPLPRWTARYLMTQDARAKESVLGTSEQAGSFGIHYRDQNTGLPISLDTYPNMTIMGEGGVFPSCGGNCSTPYTPDVAHQPSLSFVPYLVTGDFYHLEELLFWANWNLFYWGNHGGSQGLLVYDQIRAQAWGLRTLGHAAYIMPDDHPLKAYFLGKLANNLTWYDSNYSNSPPTPLGYLLNSPEINLDNTISTWMDDFFTWTVGHLANLGFSNAQAIFEYKAKFPVGRMTDPGYCWILAPTYWTRARDQSTGQPYMNWADYKTGVVRSWDNSAVGPSFAESAPGMNGANEDALIAAQCDSSQMSNILGLQQGNPIGNSWSHDGYAANMQPAVAMAAERGATGGEAAWARFDNRSVVPDSGNYDYNVSPQWAIVPGNVDPGAPGPGGQLPFVSIAATPQEIAPGETATINWSSSGADSCSASGDWSGSKGISGSENVGPSNSDQTYILQCSNAQGSRSANVTVRVTAVSVPFLSLIASSAAVAQGASVTLNWSSQDTNSCEASGSWSGAKATSGDESVGPLTQDSSFTLVCVGSGGNVSQTIAVSVTAAGGGADPTEEGDALKVGANGPWSLLFCLLFLMARSMLREKGKAAYQ